MRTADRRVVVSFVVALAAIRCGAIPDQRTVTLTPQAVASKVGIHYEVNDDFYCSFASSGLGPRIAPRDAAAAGTPVVVGREFFVDYGTNPFPCGHALRHDYAAILAFDLSGVIRDGGIVQRAILHFTRGATDQPIHLPAAAGGACTWYVLALSGDWDAGYYVGDESDPGANPPATLLFNGTPRAAVRFRNSAEPGDATQALDVTTFFASAILRRGDRYHGLLLSPRSDPTSRARYLTGWGEGILGSRPTDSSCTGVLSEFQLELTLVRLVRGTP
jgi:hypothetical protein